MTLLRDLVDASERVGTTASRLAKVAEIAGLLRRLQPDEIGVGVAYLAGETKQGRAGIGYSLIQNARIGVAGNAHLELLGVDRALDQIARTTGRGSVAERTRLLTELFAAATEREQSFLVRLLLGELRQGALDGLMIEAVASAANLPAAEVRRAAMIAGGIAAVARAALTNGLEGLHAFSIKLFQPLAPMLAQPADDIADALTRLPAASIEWKLDGARVQIHKTGNEVRVFSRTGNDLTVPAGEIVAAVRALDAHTVILDGEAIALKRDGTPYPFQDTMRRFGRALDIDRMREAMPLSVFFFDCLHLNHEDMVSRPGSERFEALAASVPPSMVIPRLVTSDLATAQAFYDDAVQRQHEGVMVKAIDALYEPGSRSAAWLKVKRAHTLDLVVIAAEWGHGRRKGWLSNLHLAARDPVSNDFVMLGKTFKGMTDATLQWQTEQLLARAISRDDWSVRVRPELVVEVTFNDLQASSRYPAGLALRFARIKGYRIDKTADQADTIETVRAIYATQSAPHSDDAL
ncbi:MAG: ATP-dependent DNA ligase [Burkholderiaceae bacterium]